MNSLIEEIRQKVADEQFEFSKHAVDQSILRQVQVQEIREIIANGQVIEDYPNDKYGPSCLISGLTQARRPIHVQCSYPSRPLVRIITLYQPDPQKWIKTLHKGETVAMTYEQETLVEKKVTYTLELNGQVFMIENVPARVNEETGEQFFSPSTVEHLQQIVLSGQQPDRFTEVPVYNYAA
ncbi:DUF4258 domain-containing protein [Nostoc sp. UIC 10890]